MQTTLGVVVIAAITLRVWAMTQGHNFDFESYLIVGDLAADTENVYAHTSRYNYGPIWFMILGGLFRVAELTPWTEGFFRTEIVLLLTAVDLATAWILWKRFSTAAALLFLFSPIAIVITGLHNQFDNLAIFTGLVALITLERAEWVERRSLKYAAYAILGVSLMTKHLLFAVPAWLAVRPGRLLDRALAIFIPVGMFIVGFLPFLPRAFEGIRENVFGYRSYENAPLLNGVFDSVIAYEPAFLLFLIALAVFGLCARSWTPVNLGLLYTVVVVVFAPAVSNQTLAIPGAAIAASFNWAYAGYIGLGGVFLVAHRNGLGWEGLAHQPPFAWWDGFVDFRGYEILVMTLGLGLVIQLTRRHYREERFEPDSGIPQDFGQVSPDAEEIDDPGGGRR